MPTCARVRAHELVTAHLDDSVGAANQSDQKKQRCCFEACCFDWRVSVTSDAEEKVPTGRRADSL
jgi:hypothetical protein